jgi:hypothetical protein
MSLPTRVLLLCAFPFTAYSNAAQAWRRTPQDGTPTASAAASASTICGDLISEVDQGTFMIAWRLKVFSCSTDKLWLEQATSFYASDVFACLTSVPFDAAVATRFIEYYNTTIQFHSTLAFLKNPPSGYQQPAIDVVAELGQIQSKIDRGFYQNQYAFEAELMRVVYGMHDGHVDLRAGILNPFSFGSPWSISSVSVDGKELPKIYITSAHQIMLLRMPAMLTL